MPGAGALGQFALGQFPQPGAIAQTIPIIDTVVLPLPVNCVLAEHEKLKMTRAELELNNTTSTKVARSASQVSRLSGAAPSFATTTRRLGSFD